MIALTNAHNNLSTLYVCSVQIEQIEQLNTLLLQDIDHNFARFHDVVNNKILPQVKRYGIVSEPTRAASEVSTTQRFVSEPSETRKILMMIFVITVRYAVLEDVLLLGSFRSDGARNPTPRRRRYIAHTRRCRVSSRRVRADVDAGPYREGGSHGG